MIKKVRTYSSIELVMDTPTRARVGALDKDYHALASEVIDEKGQVQGTILYVPGIRFKDLKVSA